MPLGIFHRQEGARQTFLLRAGAGRETRKAEQNRDRKEGYKTFTPAKSLSSL